MGPNIHNIIYQQMSESNQLTQSMSDLERSLSSTKLSNDGVPRSIWETNHAAPAPSQTYIQIAVYPPMPKPHNPSQLDLCKGCVVWREWPKQRSHSGTAIPTETRYSYDDVLDSKIDSRVKHVFGDNVLYELIIVVNYCVELTK